MLASQVPQREDVWLYDNSVRLCDKCDPTGVVSTLTINNADACQCEHSNCKHERFQSYLRQMKNEYNNNVVVGGNRGGGRRRRRRRQKMQQQQQKQQEQPGDMLNNVVDVYNNNTYLAQFEMISDFNFNIVDNITTDSDILLNNYNRNDFRETKTNKTNQFVKREQSRQRKKRDNTDVRKQSKSTPNLAVKLKRVTIEDKPPPRSSSHARTPRNSAQDDRARRRSCDPSARGPRPTDNRARSVGNVDGRRSSGRVNVVDQLELRKIMDKVEMLKKSQSLGVCLHGRERDLQKQTDNRTKEAKGADNSSSSSSSSSDEDSDSSEDSESDSSTSSSNSSSSSSSTTSSSSSMSSTSTSDGEAKRSKK